jgi:hypothetical protein
MSHVLAFIQSGHAMVLAVCHPLFIAALRFPSHGKLRKVFSGKCDTDKGFRPTYSTLFYQ